MDLDKGVSAESEYSTKDAAVAGLWAFFRLRGIRVIYGILTIVAISAVASAVRSRERSVGRTRKVAREC